MILAAMPATSAPRPALGRWVVVVAAVCVVVAACSGGDGRETGSVPTATDPPPVDPLATAVPADPGTADPTAGDPTAGDPTAGDPMAPGSPTAAGSSGVAPPPASPAPVDPSLGFQAVVDAMTLEQKVGQVFTVTVVGDHATDVSDSAATANLALYGVATPAEVVSRYHLGGVAYFDHDQGPGTSNVADLDRTAALSAGLQRAAAADTGIGLLIGTDQEGGPVVRLTAPATVFPAARAIGDTGQVDLAEQAGRVTGTEARAVGVNWVYAPTADVNSDPDNPVIGDRAFGTTVEQVVPFVRATARGLADGGVLPTLKHFPGHGDTRIDSHNSLPTIDRDRATLQAVDLAPFDVATSLEVPVSVMVGHLAVPALDSSGRPATISPLIIAVLRQDLGFDGLVVTDAMTMGALDGFGDSGELAVQALAAGIDMVLLPGDLPVAWDAVLQAVREGTLDVDRLDQAVERILRAKAGIGVLDAAAVEPGDPGVIGSPAHTRVRDRIGQACGC